MSHDQASPSKLQSTGMSASITVKDLAASLDWYEHALGFHVEQRYEREGKVVGASISAGNLRLVLNQEDGKKGWDRVKGLGLSFQINMASGVDAVADRLKARGTTLLNEPADFPWGQRMVQFHDPDGYLLRVSMPVAG
ncbi:MAG TPA: VOC family protein [Gemmatimonadales bacterium]|jgi:uncharacterized glyoxalase superfamily protein PhnB